MAEVRALYKQFRLAEGGDWSWTDERHIASPGPWAELLLLLFHGLRIGEALGLLKTRLNVSRNLSVVGEQKLEPFSAWIVERWTYRNRRSGRRGVGADAQRVVPLSASLCEGLSRYSSDPGDQPDCPVFKPRATNKPYNRNTLLYGLLKPAAKKCGIPWATWRTIERTALHFADLAGLSKAEIAELVGQRRTGQAVNPGRLREAVEAIDGWIVLENEPPRVSSGISLPDPAVHTRPSENPNELPLGPASMQEVSLGLVQSASQPALGLELRQARKRAGDSQESAAAELGMSRVALARIERGETTPHPSNERNIRRYISSHRPA